MNRAWLRDMQARHARADLGARRQATPTHTSVPLAVLPGGWLERRWRKLGGAYRAAEAWQLLVEAARMDDECPNLPDGSANRRSPAPCDVWRHLRRLASPPMPLSHPQEAGR